jgi:hypothetical protein
LSVLRQGFVVRVSDHRDWTAHCGWTFGAEQARSLTPHLVAKNLPRDDTLGASPSATANRLAWECEVQLTNPEAEAENKRAPQFLVTDPSNLPGREVPGLVWAVQETGFGEPQRNNITYIAGFTYGRQRVSLRAVLDLSG